MLCQLAHRRVGTRAPIRTEKKQFLKLPCLPVAPREHDRSATHGRRPAIGSPGEIRTHQPLVSKTSASTNWATGPHPRQDSNLRKSRLGNERLSTRLRGQTLAPGEGIEPESLPDSESGVLPVRRPRNGSQSRSRTLIARSKISRPAVRRTGNRTGIPEQIRTANLNLRRVARFQLRYRDKWRKRSESNAQGSYPGTLARCCHTIRRRFQNGRG